MPDLPVILYHNNPALHWGEFNNTCPSADKKPSQCLVSGFFSLLLF